MCKRTNSLQTKQTFGLVALIATLLASAAPSSAQDKPKTFATPSSIIGNWTFQTAKYRDSTCQMSGRMSIKPSITPSAFTCSFTAIEECAGADRWVVEQTCEAVKRNADLTISSQIVNFLESKEFTGSYAADHFVLKINNKHLMTGSLVSAVKAAVEFRREEENLS